MSYSATVLADSPVAYWRLGEASGTSAADATGNGHTGTYTGTAGSSYSLGNAGALTGDTATCPYFADFNGGAVSATGLSSMTTWTIEGWCKTNGNQDSANNVGIVTDGYVSTTVNFCMSFVAPLGITVGFYDGTWHQVPNYTLTDATWYHVVGTYDGTTVRLYINGVDKSDLTYTGTPSHGGGSCYISQADFNTNCFKGNIQEVAVYSTALSATRILAHYNAGITSPATSAPSFVIATFRN